MTPYLVYGIVEADASFAGARAGALAAAGGEPVELVVRGDLGAIVSPVPEPKNERRSQLEDICKYHRVVMAVHERTTILPFRYGTVLCGDSWYERRDEFARRLAALRGCTELGVRIRLEPPAPDAPSCALPHGPGSAGSGHSYLAMRRRVYAGEQAIARQAELLAARCLELLGDFYVEARRETSVRPRPPFLSPTLSLHFLVRRQEVPGFRTVFSDALCPAVPAEVRLSGPWPPYDFVDGEADSVGAVRSDRGERDDLGALDEVLHRDIGR